MPGGNRRLPRTVRATVPPPVVQLIPGDMIINRYSPLGTSVPTLPGLEQPNAPKHFPFPNTPVDDDLLFEFLMFMHAVTAACLQFLHLYRSVWWLPHSYTNQSVNFYLIDTFLVIFIIIILSRRMLYIFGSKILEYCIPGKYQMICLVCYRIFLFTTMVVLLSWCAYHVIQNHTIVKIFYLCYPISVYLILFGFTVMPFFELVSSNCGSLPPLHACSSNPSAIRSEVENLKTNFNNRMKQILFSSILNAYYAGFVPCCFAQSFLYYDLYWVTQHVVYVWVGCFTSYAIHILSPRYCDTLHRSALHLGSWDRVETRSHLPVAYTWQDDMLWPIGALVRHGRDLYRAQGESNAAEPGNAMYSRFYSIFKNPSMALTGLLALQISLVLIQLALLIRNSYWYYIVSLTLLLFFNYYTLFKIGRDYLVSLKVYRTEQAMHDKISGN